MRIGGQRIHRTLSAARPSFVAAGMLVCLLLLNLALTFFSAPQPESSFPSASGAPAPQRFRSVAERDGNFAAMNDGAGSGAPVQIRSGRPSPTFARRLQSEAVRLNPLRVRESVPDRLDRIGSLAQTFLFQLFPRCFLPVRAGPLPA